MKPQDLLPHQLDWLRANSPAFARSYADVQRRDAEVAKSNARLAGSGNGAIYPGEAAELVNIHAFVKRAR